MRRHKALTLWKLWLKVYFSPVFSVNVDSTTNSILMSVYIAVTRCVWISLIVVWDVA